MLGFSDAEMENFSKRTRQIAAYVAEQGPVPLDDKARMQADERAALATRRRKDRSLTPARLAERWGREADESGLATGPPLEGRGRDASLGQRRVGDGPRHGRPVPR